MQIVSDVVSVIGPTTEIRWGQALLSPSLYGVIEVEEAVGGAMKLGVEALSTLTHAKEFSGGLSDLERLAHTPEGRWIRTIILLVPVGNILTIALRGSGCVYLKRGEKLARLIENERGISGEVRKGDIVLLATDRFRKTLPENELSSVFDHEDAEGVAEKLTLKLHENHEGQGGAALIFEVKDLAEQAIAQPRPQLLKNFPKRTMLLGLFTVCIALLFAVSVVFGIVRQQAARRNNEVVRVLSEAQRALEEGNALLELNPTKGRKRLEDAHDLLAPLTQTLSPKSDEGRQVAELFSQVAEQLKRAKNSVAAEPQLFYDVGLLKNGSTIGSIGIYETQVALLDERTPTVYELDIRSKNGQIVAGGAKYTRSTHIAIHGEAMYVVVDSGINVAHIGEKKTTTAVVKKSDEWENIAALTAYGGNLYLLDSGASRIWKYVATENGFSKISEYLNPDIFVDFSGATSMAVDGTVWVGTSDGKILRFVGGRQETFAPQGVDPAFSASLTIYTSDEEKNLYVLDASNKRVVMLNKEGVYLGQYTWQDDFVPTQLVVSEIQKKILLLGSGKLYSLDLK